MNQHIEKIRTRLTNELLDIGEIRDEREKVTKSLKALEKAVHELDSYIETHPFTGDAEEILYFKTVKPEFIARRIEEVMRYNIAVNKPVGPLEIQVRYLEDELKVIHSFFRMNAFHYQYYRNGFSDLDRIYFLRDAQPLSEPLTEVSESDPSHSTAVSLLFAKFMAYENMQHFIMEHIGLLKYPDMKPPKSNHLNPPEMRWTGDSINIVEVAYGIWLTGQLNNGNASLNQIVRWLEINLYVNIGVVQRRFIEIERRKRLSPTKYIDQMRDSIIRKIESGSE